MKTFTESGQIVTLTEEPIVNNLATMPQAEPSKIVGLAVMIPSEDPDIPRLAYVPFNTFATPAQLTGLVTASQVQSLLPDVSGFALKSELKDWLTASQVQALLPDLSGYAVKSDLTGLAKTSDVQQAIAPLSSALSNTVTTAALQQAGYAQKTDIPSIAGLATVDALAALNTALTQANTATATVAQQAKTTAAAAEQMVSTRARVYPLGEVTISKAGPTIALAAGVDVIEVSVPGVLVGDVLSVAQTTTLPTNYHVGMPIVTKADFVSFQINRPALALNVGYSFKAKVAAIR